MSSSSRAESITCPCTTIKATIVQSFFVPEGLPGHAACGPCGTCGACPCATIKATMVQSFFCAGGRARPFCLWPLRHLRRLWHLHRLRHLRHLRHLWHLRRQWRQWWQVAKVVTASYGEEKE